MISVEARAENPVSILDLLANGNTRFEAAEMILGREVPRNDTSVTQYFISLTTPEEMLTGLLLQAAKESGSQIV